MIARRKNWLPHLFTASNLFFGFLSILNALQGKLVTASWLIIMASVLDAVDGKLARLTKTTSKFGLELDSIADVVSFGVAPSILVYQFFCYKIGVPGVMLSFLPLVFGALRLARFSVNQKDSHKERFEGLPIPCMAVTLSSYVVFNYDLWQGLSFTALLPALIILLSVLMVTGIEYETVPELTFRKGKRNSIHLLLMMLGLFIIIILRGKALFPMVLGYVLHGLLRLLLHHSKEDKHATGIFHSD